MFNEFDICTKYHLMAECLPVKVTQTYTLAKVIMESSLMKSHFRNSGLFTDWFIVHFKVNIKTLWSVKTSAVRLILYIFPPNEDHLAIDKFNMIQNLWRVLI